MARPDEAPAPDASLETSSEVRDAGSRLLQRLSPQERAAVVLKEVFDMTLEEIADLLATTTGAVKAALHHGIKRIVLTGGVAANGPLRAGLEAAAIEHGLRLHVPPRHLCTDNAAMITAAGSARLAAGERASLNLNAAPDLALAE